MFEPGADIVIRDVWRGGVWEATPVVVVQHDDGWLVDHQAPGTTRLARTCRGSEKLDALESLQWSLAPTTTTEPGLNFYVAGGWSRIGMAWSGDFTDFRGWYVNFQLPLRRSRFGFDTMDLVLDARISPSFEWSWKDEKDFADARRRGIFDATVEDAVRGHAAQVQDILDRREGPFADHWRLWRSPKLAVPSLPPDATVA